ncbi:14480_t:CDS:2, partial [Gigaspora margarita]
MSSETSTSGCVYNETSTSGHVYNETSTSEHVYNENILQHKTKSFKSFLFHCRDMIINSTPATSSWKNLNNAWNTRFMNKAQTLLNPEDFKILEDK